MMLEFLSLALLSIIVPGSGAKSTSYPHQHSDPARQWMSHFSFCRVYTCALRLPFLSLRSPLSPKDTLSAGLTEQSNKGNTAGEKETLDTFSQSDGFQRDGATDGWRRSSLAPFLFFYFVVSSATYPKNPPPCYLPSLCLHFSANKQYAYTTRDFLIVFFCNTHKNKSLSPFHGMFIRSIVGKGRWRHVFS